MNQKDIKTLHYNNHIPENAKKLIWDVFFLKKNRGIDFNTHFPWIENSKDFFCVTHETQKNNKTTTISALILKIERTSTSKKFGLIGLVCVDQNFRGNGLSKQLLLKAIELAKLNDLCCLLLWTTQPWLYTKVGFAIESYESFGVIKKMNSNQNQINFDLEINSKNVNHYGVPAFADEIIEYFDQTGTEVILCRSKENLTLARWRGDSQKILAIIEKIFKREIYINISENDNLLSQLRAHDYDVELRTGSICMKLELSKSGSGNSEKIPYLDILQRI